MQKPRSNPNVYIPSERYKGTIYETDMKNPHRPHIRLTMPGGISGHEEAFPPGVELVIEIGATMPEGQPPQYFLTKAESGLVAFHMGPEAKTLFLPADESTIADLFNGGDCAIVRKRWITCS